MTLDEQIARLRELDAKRTQGEWYWSARTLRSEIRDSDDEVTDKPDILYRDGDGCIYAFEADRLFIAAAPTMMQIINTLTAKLKTAEEALDRLCKLKEYKDKNGKDEHYTSIRQGVWEAAQEALAQIRGKS